MTEKAPCSDCLVKMMCKHKICSYEGHVIVERLEECPPAKDYILDENNPHSRFARDFHERIAEISKELNLRGKSFLWRASHSSGGKHT